jgi:hypothetical protein
MSETAKVAYLRERIGELRRKIWLCNGVVILAFLLLGLPIILHYSNAIDISEIPARYMNYLYYLFFFLVAVGIVGDFYYYLKCDKLMRELKRLAQSTD